MKYGIYYAYWEKEWNGDYKYYIDKISKLGFDILEISCGAFSDYYTKDQELIDIGKYAKEKGVTLTAGYGPHFNESLSSSEPNTQKQAIMERDAPEIEVNGYSYGWRRTLWLLACRLFQTF